MAKKKGLPLGTFLKRFSSETQCQEYLASLRWQTGYVCPKCGCCHGYRLFNGRYQCTRCRHQVLVTAGTVLHKPHMPLTQWFLVFYFVSRDKRGISVVQLAAMLGTTYNRTVHAPAYSHRHEPAEWNPSAVRGHRIWRCIFSGPTVGKSGAGAQKKRRFSWRCFWMTEVIPVSWKCG